ncbi:hypothetical protein BD769DRAFT_581414 [Suillus cothurnatus]|nr:hypothetical protein BD769DRAFT_581414 [Suillus cothurnatus]
MLVILLLSWTLGLCRTSPALLFMPTLCMEFFLASSSRVSGSKCAPRRSQHRAPTRSRSITAGLTLRLHRFDLLLWWTKFQNLTMDAERVSNSSWSHPEHAHILLCRQFKRNSTYNYILTFFFFRRYLDIISVSFMACH